MMGLTYCLATRIFILGLVCSASEVYDVKVDCEHLIPQTPMYCSFNQGPLHPCEIITQHIFVLKSLTSYCSRYSSSSVKQ